LFFSIGMRNKLVSLYLLPILLYSLPSLKDTIIPDTWYYLGPFPVAPREGITGITEEEIKYFCDTTKIYRSIFPDSGIIRWQKVEKDSLNWVKVDYEDILWDTLIDFYGFALIQSLTYFYTEVFIPEECRALVMAERASFFLNGISYPGDPYGHNFVRIPVVLKKGKNSILLKVSGFPPHRFQFALLPAKEPVLIIKDDITAPTLVPGENRVLIGFPILNTEERSLWVRLRVAGKGVEEKEISLFLYPQMVKKVPIEFKADVSPAESLFPVYWHLTGEGFSSLDSLTLLVKKAEDVQKITFISRIDSSVQYFALRFPKNYQKDREYSLIVSLHGAGVEAVNQAESYLPKDWAFIACPTNRRPFGFDWQDWGRIDALEVIEYLKRKYPIDTNRIYLTGHSMGGHGVWHIGLLYPSLFAAIAPGAGWPSHQLYVPWTFQRSEVFASSQVLAIRNRVLKIDQTLPFLENALNLPIFIFHGSRDDNVPPLFARMFASYLADLGYRYFYKEVPQKRHWYYLDEGTVCVDDPEIMEFFQKEKRDPFPKRIIFQTSDLDIASQAYWLKITELEKDQEVGRIEGEVRGETIEIKSKNVRGLKLELPKDFTSSGFLTLLINGKRQRIKSKPSLILYRRGEQFYLADTFKPELRGPMRKAYFSPFLLVYGTKSDSLSVITYQQAKREAFLWWRIGNGRCDLLPDTLVGEEEMKRYNLIIFGGPSANYLSERLAGGLPIKEDKGELLFFNKRLSGELAYRYIYPNPRGKEKFVLIAGGTNQKVLKLSTFFSTLYSSAGLPDFIIFSPEVEKKGWGGIRACGFFNRNWGLTPGDYFLQE